MLLPDEDFKEWLRNLVKVIGDPEAICQLCYDVRRSRKYTSLHIRARAGSPCADKYEAIRHHIGRLNHTMKATKVVVSAVLKLPHLVDGFQIVRHKASPTSRPPLKERNPSLADIAGRMLIDPAETETIRQALEDLDLNFGLSAELQEQCSSPTWKPRVHAELIILDIFWTQNLEFVGQDRYIGCSKPACYCCYNYIVAHPGKFVPPACHNNNYLNWRPPDVLDANDYELLQAREKILNSMIESIRFDALTQIMARRGPNKWRPDSMTEISSLRLENARLMPSTDLTPLSEEDFSGAEESYLEDVTSEHEAGSERSLNLESETEEEGSDGGVAI
jgi:hypothetical protein